MSQPVNVTELAERLAAVRDSLTELSLLLSDYQANLVLLNGGDSVTQTDALMKKLVRERSAAQTGEHGE